MFNFQMGGKEQHFKRMYFCFYFLFNLLLFTKSLVIVTLFLLIFTCRHTVSNGHSTSIHIKQFL